MSGEGYTLLEEIGSGAVARVVRVRAADGRELAGKILHTSREDDAEAVERFAREAHLVSQLDHPNIVRVFGLERIDAHDVLLMERVDGPPLDEALARDGALGSDRIVALGRGIANGLAAAHEKGVVHRDLKPANILVATGDVPKIVDFGMARASSMQGVDPSTFSVQGTPDYMAPEALDPLAVDARGDLYALGCILYELATGKPPYSGATAFAVLEAHRDAPIPRLPRELPGRLISLIELLLAKSPADRLQSAESVVQWLDSLDDGGELALARQTSGVARTGTCAACGSPLVADLGVCLACGLAAPSIKAGEFSLFVTGPGGIADKIDSGLRQKFLEWIAANDALDLDASELAKKIPRLPFCVITDVSEASARGLASSLQNLGLQAEVCRGGRSSLPAARKKAAKVGVRMLAIMAASSAYLLSQGLFGGIFIWLGLLMLIPAIAAFRTLRPRTQLRGEARAELPPAIAERLGAIAKSGPTLRAPRHRTSLRGVVSSALALRSSVTDEATDAEVANALDIALVATGRLDALDRELESRDLQRADAQTRELLAERDVWSSRLLELHATIESLRARLIAARASAGKVQDDDALDELRAKVEALEEVTRT